MLFTYNVTVPLTYNRFAILSNNPKSELQYKIEHPYEEEFEISFGFDGLSDSDDNYMFKDVFKVKLYKAKTDNDQSSNNQQKDTIEVICEICGLPVTDETQARKWSERIIGRICKRLSLVFIKYNNNRHLYQPRVEAIWSMAVFKGSVYAPFVKLTQKVLEMTNGNDKEICLQDCIPIGDEEYCIARQSIPPDEIKIKEWLSPNDDVVEFLMNEYYSALGTENIKSKFFHLFSMIEFCETEYKEHNGSNRLLSDDEVYVIIEIVEKQIDSKRKKKIKSILTNTLKRVTDIGRTEKLQNILKWMGIEKYNQFGDEKDIDKKLLDDITTLRNKSFHGTKEGIADAEKNYADAVDKLLSINERILDFLMNRLHQGKV